jgi:hypothetical protein
MIKGGLSTVPFPRAQGSWSWIWFNCQSTRELFISVTSGLYEYILCTLYPTSYFRWCIGLPPRIIIVTMILRPDLAVLGFFFLLLLCNAAPSHPFYNEADDPWLDFKPLHTTVLMAGRLLPTGTTIPQAPVETSQQGSGGLGE